MLIHHHRSEHLVLEVSMMENSLLKAPCSFLNRRNKDREGLGESVSFIFNPQEVLWAVVC